MSDYATLQEELYYAYQYLAELEALVPAGSLPDRPPQIKPRPGPPVMVDAPAVTVNGAMASNGAVGDTLTCTNGNWQGEPTGYAYDWDALGADTSAQTYTVDAADAGASITCTVTATNAHGSTAASPSNAIAIPGAAAEEAAAENAENAENSRHSSRDTRHRR